MSLGGAIARSAVVAMLATSLFLVGCGRQGNATNGAGGYDPVSQSQSDGIPLAEDDGSGTQNKGGGDTSASDFDSLPGLGDADQQALAAAANASANLDPRATGDGIPAALLQQLQALLRKRGNGVEVFAALSALAGQILQAAAKKIPAFVPLAGQPLIGDWLHTATADGGVTRQWRTAVKPLGNLQYHWHGEAMDESRGGYKAGVFAARSDGGGSGEMASFGYTGKFAFADNPGPVGQTSGYNYAGHFNFTGKLALTASRNPIPANYQEATRILGRAYVRAVFLQSPAVNEMLQRLDPRTAAGVLGALVNAQ